MNILRKFWASLNYRYCKSNQYLAEQRKEGVVAAEWSGRAMDWQREYLMAGRRMV